MNRGQGIVLVAVVVILAMTAHAAPRKGHIVGLGTVKRVAYS